MVVVIGIGSGIGSGRGWVRGTGRGSGSCDTRSSSTVNKMLEQ